MYKEESNIMAYIHWSFSSLLFYIFLGYIGWYCAVKGLKASPVSRKKHYIFWYITWIVSAEFRLVNDSGVGGVDAYGYIYYFKDCLNPNTTSIHSYRAEFLFRLLNRCIRSFTEDYHLYFFVIYSLIVFSYIFFIKEFYNEYCSSAMLPIMFYTYLVSFSILRTGLSIALYLIGITLLGKKKYVRSIFFITLGALIHTATLVYVGFVIFYFIYRKSPPRLLDCIFFACSGYVLAKIVQIATINGNFHITIGQPLDVYFSVSLGQGFWVDYWKIVVTQILLVCFILVFKYKIEKRINLIFDKAISQKIYFIYLLCIYDLILIPLTFVLNIWRAVDYLYLARLIFWGYIIKILHKSVIKKERKYITGFFFLIALIYIVLRIYTNYEKAGLMPYIYEPLYLLFK